MRKPNSFTSLIMFFPCMILLMSSCSILKKQDSKPQVQAPVPAQKKQEAETSKLEESKIPEIKNYTAIGYIERFKAIAIREMNSSGIPASITLAQGILESGNGNSELALKGNNHFGIKCTPEWKGKTMLKDDDKKDDCFRVYKTPEESFKDHSEFLKRKRYAPLFELDKNDYKGWARGLKAAGYATNPRYAELLISLIERYNLNQFDRMESPREKIVREDKVLTEIAKNIPLEKKDEPARTRVIMKIHEVKSGDTLASLSKLYGISIDEIKMLNGLDDTNLKPGQLLVVSK
jgi:flagellum-specific peptidoglycan hydrolase FlgJ